MAASNRFPSTTRLVRLAIAAITIGLLAACGGGGGDSGSGTAPPPPPPPSTVSLELRVDVADGLGRFVADASISVAGTTASGTTNPQGRGTLSLPGPSAPTAYVLRVTKPGHTEQTVVVPVDAQATTASASAMLMARPAAVAIPAIESGGTAVGTRGVRVTFPAQALQNAQGQPVTGAIDMLMTPVDVTGTEAAAFPGLFEGIATGGARVPIVSHGVAEFVPTQGGQKLSLVPGRTATIEIPLFANGNLDGSPVTVGQRIPLWSLNTTTGLWTQEGEGEVVASSAAPRGLVLRASVSHFSWWNIDVPATQRHTVIPTLRGPAGLATIPRGSAVRLEARVDNNGVNGIWLPTQTASINVNAPLDLPLPFTYTAGLRLPGGLRITGSAAVVINNVTYSGSFSNVGGPAGQTSSVTIDLAAPTEPLPQIVLPAQDITVPQGAVVPIEIRVAGPTPDSVELRRDGAREGTPWPAQALYPTLLNTATLMPGTYTLTAVAVRGGTSFTSQPRRITVGAALAVPAITTQPASATVTVGQSATFSVVATGVPAPTYQWRRNGVAIAGATAPSYTTPATTIADNGVSFSVVVTNSLGSVTSNPATLTVNAAAVAPVVTTNPQNVTINAGANASFSAAASGTPTPVVVWYATRPGVLDAQLRNGANAVCTGSAALTANGVDTGTLTLTNVPQACSGLQLRARFANAAGIAESSAALLTVNVAPPTFQITAQPQSLTRDLGQSAAFTVAATGPGTLSYQWQRSEDGGVTYSNIAGATSASYTLNPVRCVDEDARYRAEVRDSTLATPLQSAAALVTIPPLTTPATPSLEAGLNHLLALDRAGRTFGWGSNSSREIDPTFTGSPTLTSPRPLRFACRLTQISSRSFLNLGLRADGTVLAWGSGNEYGQLGDVSNLFSGARVVDVVAGLTNVTAVAAGEDHGLALRTDGTVWSWGHNFRGQLGRTAGLGTFGQGFPTPAQVPGLSNVVAIAAGWSFSMALRNDGTVWSWGKNDAGQLGQGSLDPGIPGRPTPAQVFISPTAVPPVPLTNVVALAATNRNGALVVRADGTVLGWGQNENGQIAPNPMGSPMSYLVSPTQVLGITGATGVGGNNRTGMATTTAGLRSWGNNFYGLFANGTTGTGTNLPPTPAVGLPVELLRVVISGTNDTFAAALSRDGRVWVWGLTGGGLAGDGNVGSFNAPVTTAAAVPGLDLDPTQ